MATSSQTQLTTKVEEWPTLEATAAKLGASIRTIWRYTKEGAIQTRKRARPGKKPEIVCNPVDVERLMPPESHAITEAGQSLTLKRAGRKPAASWEGALETIASIMTAQRESVAIGAKLWLSLEEASVYSGRTTAWLLRACQTGTLVAEKDGGWKIMRESLDAYGRKLLLAHVTPKE
jgi:hypothetical protein